MQYVPAGVLWALALIKLPKAKETQSRHVFWAAFFAAIACTFYVPQIYLAVDAFLGGRNVVKLATLISLMLGFWQFRSAILIAISTDARRCQHRLVVGHWAVIIASGTAISGFLASDPGATSPNLQLAYADEPGMKIFLVSGSIFLVWAGFDLMMACLRALPHLRSAAFRVGFLLIALGCAASCLAISDRVIYGSISDGARPTTVFTTYLDSGYWILEALAVLCIGTGLILPAIRQPVRDFLQNLEARTLVLQLRPAWLRATAAYDEIVLKPSAFELLTPLKPHARQHLHRRFIEINDGFLRSGRTAVVLPKESALLERAELLLARL
ncbi:MAB_1171c family putative transporter [Arthrobacter sp. SDTb3-6]|uniref:MAB_1171c family putative transporter n=1 Tax=Arthrobacter sp. SDTb3-6 TaxID=2713571 RepID=UPI00159EB5F4|nr:MAB_1171c family putative transporter [Arthrobacter sp. SDTb3-6]NVM97757.1 hypothetical protein [Arthrobacter sp. SDTb3-6]